MVRNSLSVLALLAAFVVCNAFSCNKGNDNNTASPAPIAAAKINAAKLLQNGGAWSCYALHWNYYKPNGTLDFTNGQDKYDAAYTWPSSANPTLTFAPNGTYSMTDRVFFSDILPVENGNWTLSTDSTKLGLPSVYASSQAVYNWKVQTFTDTKMQLQMLDTEFNGEVDEVILKFER